MKSPALDYVRVDSLSAAFDAFEAGDGDAQFLAGGHSVVPALNLRLQAPSLLIDISRIPELSGVELCDGWLRICAMTRHAEALTHPLIIHHAPLLCAAAPFVAHPAIRNRATIGGNLVLADPASEFPAAALAMRAEMEIVGRDGVRRVPADAFFLGLYETAMRPGEILRSLFVPPAREGQRVAFDELSRRRGDYAIVGAAIQAVMADQRLSDISIAFLAVGDRPIRAAKAEAALRGGALDGATIAAAQAALEGDLDLEDLPQMPASMRLHLARVLLGRVLGRLGGP
ncbi:FAD binding domain-containing protein [Pseudorhizobium pelagicum]|uniref:Molybdopterin dehydrogenase n=1 Tax=Pseudorhizobium pelagicum TaxID=1509405 RepID=A0A922NYE2_9HYPH|nr:xanthine dehydrogenase family protein subunit M [Pseudorhizobium pelagicum]KEQ02823.1 molybdopterin dehydrogenase [Pseudorhizobium pelagicum]KEQ02894.1 molybdopterin dehydrogenase [Pseudorhizobium pelagicum]